ncbi:MFS general substrate transporter [Pleomassaria siparia CBS 279.74]|uniref:MFS general substrate transporter n=1 Tax=Pleomassaria siparia CBS 279.74 TaxID=1314801 RepID=A0A6G1KNJ1_9PLEO|nr:MFS general substrate transporter [Pleomassaria siparia CBS 279.74]
MPIVFVPGWLKRSKAHTQSSLPTTIQDGDISPVASKSPHKPASILSSSKSNFHHQGQDASSSNTQQEQTPHNDSSTAPQLVGSPKECVPFPTTNIRGDDGASNQSSEYSGLRARNNSILSQALSENNTRPALERNGPSLTPSTKWSRGPGFWRSFVAICIPLLLSALEGSVTNTALPTISDALNLGTGFSWVATAFLLASTIFQPLYGQLADIWGRKYPMMIAIVIFGLGSAICGWANSGAVLIFGRIVQGLGTGGVDLFAEMVLCDIVPLRKRGLYTAIKHVVYAVGTTIGPLLGGVFAEHGWRWCFWINIPVCVMALGMLWWWLSVGGGVKAKDVKLVEELKKVDGWGTALLTMSVILVLVALSEGGAAYPWSHPTIVALMTIGVSGLVVFPFFECSRWCSHPIMPPAIFSNATSRVAFALTAIHGFVTYGVQFFLPVFFQAVKGSSPTNSGMEVLPTTLVIVVLAAIGGPLLSYWGRYKPIHQVGFAFMVIGFGLCTMLSRSTPVWEWTIFQLLVAAGSGIIVSTLLPAVQVELPDTTNGASAGSWAFLRGTGSLFGVAVPGAIFNVRFSQLLPTISNATAQRQLANGQAYQRTSPAFLDKFGQDVKKEIVHGFEESLRCVWIVFMVVVSIGFALTFLEKQVKMRKELNTAYGLKTPRESPISSEASTPKRTSLEKIPEKLGADEEA